MLQLVSHHPHRREVGSVHLMLSYHPMLIIHILSVCIDIVIIVKDIMLDARVLMVVLHPRRVNVSQYHHPSEVILILATTITIPRYEPIHVTNVANVKYLDVGIDALRAPIRVTIYANIVTRRMPTTTTLQPRHPHHQHLVNR